MKEGARFSTPSFLTKIIRSGLWMGIFGIFIHDCVATEDDGRPSEHLCPITYEVMKDPVVAADGYSYERRAIERYFRGPGNARSPMTGLPLPNKTVVPNQALKIMINDWTPGIPVTPSPLSSDADILAKRIREEFQRNTALLDASKERHIVAFLGNTGAGKSTLVNLLAGKNLIVSDDEEDYVLANPQDTTAMAIGRGGHSETVYPKFIDVENLRFFDLPGFNDTDGSERNLMNAAFIRKILLDAASVRLVFVAGQDQFTADRSASVRQLFDSIRQLFVVDERNVNVVDDGVFVATKVTCAPQAEITDFLSRRTDSRDKVALNQQLKLWSERNQLGRMFHPLREAQNKGIREQILELIQGAKSAKIRGLNVSVLYPPDTKEPLERLFFKVFEGAFALKLQEPLETLSDYDRVLGMYASGSFWAKFDGEVCKNEDAVRLLKDFCINPYHQALKTFEKENAGRLQEHIDHLSQKRQERIGYIEKRTEARTKKVIASLVPPQVESEYVFFDFAYHKDFYDQVCGKGSIQEISQDILEQEVARQYYAGFISQHSHDQVMHWHQRFVGPQMANMEGIIQDLKVELVRTKEEAVQRAAFLQKRLEESQTANAVAQTQAEHRLTQMIATLQTKLQMLESRQARGVQPSSSSLPSLQYFGISPAQLGPTIPPVARGHEEIYLRFLKGVLIYKPSPRSDEGRIELPIAALRNPLKGMFNLSGCGDAGKYLSIATGYRKSTKVENEDKVEIWIAPRFLIEKELNRTAKYFETIFSNWNPNAEVGMFWTHGSWAANDHDMEYLTTHSMDEISQRTLYENWLDRADDGVEPSGGWPYSRIWKFFTLCL